MTKHFGYIKKGNLFKFAYEGDRLTITVTYNGKLYSSAFNCQYDLNQITFLLEDNFNKNRFKISIEKNFEEYGEKELLELNLYYEVLGKTMLEIFELDLCTL